MVRYTMLIAFMAITFTACSENTDTVEETQEAAAEAHVKMTEEIKTTAEAMTEEASTETDDATTTGVAK